MFEVVGNADSVAPEQIGATAVNVGAINDPAVVTVMVEVLVQPLASFTVMVYVPAARPVNILLDWKVIPSLL